MIQLKPTNLFVDHLYNTEVEGFDFVGTVNSGYCKCRYGSFMSSSHPYKEGCKHLTDTIKLDFNPSNFVEGFFKHDLSEHFDCWRNYYNPSGITYSCETPAQSFASLLNANGVTLGKDTLKILKQNNI